MIRDGKRGKGVVFGNLSSSNMGRSKLPIQGAVYREASQVPTQFGRSLAQRSVGGGSTGFASRLNKPLRRR
jgi:hypothetical protein